MKPPETAFLAQRRHTRWIWAAFREAHWSSAASSDWAEDFTCGTSWLPQLDNTTCTKNELTWFLDIFWNMLTFGDGILYFSIFLLISLLSLDCWRPTKKLKSHRSSKYSSRYFRMIASPDLLCSCTGYQDMISHDSAREIGATTEKVYDVYYFWAM